MSRRVGQSILGAVILLSWTILFGRLAIKFGDGSRLIEACGMVAGASMGLTLAWGIELLTAKLKKEQSGKS